MVICYTAKDNEYSPSLATDNRAERLAPAQVAAAHTAHAHCPGTRPGLTITVVNGAVGPEEQGSGKTTDQGNSLQEKETVG